MGHLFRALNFLTYLYSHNEPAVLLLNEHQPALALLRARHIPFEVVSLNDLETGWETRVIEQYHITVWLNDRLDTDLRHARRIRSSGVKLVTIDDRGTGVREADLHFAPLILDEKEKLGGNKIFRGPAYLILDPEIDGFKKVRHQQDKVLVTLGGSDTHGTTLKVVELLKAQGKTATVITGPAFEHHDPLRKLLTPSFQLINGVPSLIETFSHYDLAITGGGVTPFEANASGLPCIVIANEWFEIPVCQYLENIGSSVYAGPHDHLDREVFTQALSIEAMSLAGMAQITTQGARNIFREIQSL